ncbi:hypothetical protein GCM10010211_15140 [Streptomyces albospinus]|uniref:Uncharacterized protein n=1 Tax=Streptomyces albospinus TaxID=285515 RepID=A0ABQ2UV67_9ACTN|nr:hypothetical protein [Streptomyces albospinus]GGU51439.1 hypothetical protein GCM10010211_15140 [Streptomyces albospinus]
MRKLHKVAVVAVALGSVGFFGAGTSYAYGGQGGGSHVNVGQGSQCRTHDLNVDVLGEVGILNGVLANAINGEGSAGAQATPMGSGLGCNNSALSK